MESKFNDNTWRMLIHFAEKICLAKTSDEVYKLFFNFYDNLFGIDCGGAFAACGTPGNTKVEISYLYDFDDTDNAFAVSKEYIAGDYMQAKDYFMLPYCNVFRETEVKDYKTWIYSDLYKNIWKKWNVHWGIMAILVYKDTPTAMLCMFRKKDRPDFTDNDVFAVKVLADTIAKKLFLLRQESEKTSKQLEYPLKKKAAEFGLTRQEFEIVRLICQTVDSIEICQTLCITQSTLSKHLSSIYRKTATKNRVELFKLFS